MNRWLDFGRRARTELKRQGLGSGGVPRYVGRDAGAENQPFVGGRTGQWNGIQGPRDMNVSTPDHKKWLYDPERNVGGVLGASAKPWTPRANPRAPAKSSCCIRKSDMNNFPAKTSATQFRAITAQSFEGRREADLKFSFTVPSNSPRLKNHVC